MAWREATRPKGNMDRVDGAVLKKRKPGARMGYIIRGARAPRIASIHCTMIQKATLELSMEPREEPTYASCNEEGAFFFLSLVVSHGSASPENDRDKATGEPGHSDTDSLRERQWSSVGLPPMCGARTSFGRILHSGDMYNDKKRERDVVCHALAIHLWKVSRGKRKAPLLLLVSRKPICKAIDVDPARIRRSRYSSSADAIQRRHCLRANWWTATVAPTHGTSIAVLDIPGRHARCTLDRDSKLGAGDEAAHLLDDGLSGRDGLSCAYRATLRDVVGSHKQGHSRGMRSTVKCWLIVPPH